MGWCKTELDEQTHDWVKEQARIHDVRVQDIVEGCVINSYWEKNYHIPGEDQ